MENETRSSQAAGIHKKASRKFLPHQPVVLVKCKGQIESLTPSKEKKTYCSWNNEKFTPVLTVFDAFLAISEDLSLKTVRGSMPPKPPPLLSHANAFSLAPPSPPPPPPTPKPAPRTLNNESWNLGIKVLQ